MNDSTTPAVHTRTPIDYPAVIEAESSRIVAAVEANPTNAIPWSENWTVAHSAKHVGIVHHVVAKMVEQRPTGNFGLAASLETPERSDPELGRWIASGTTALVDQLRNTDPNDECWSWSEDGHHVKFWARRMAQETLIHRWDAELGAGIDGVAIDPSLAADGVDEYLDIFTLRMRQEANSPAGPSISFEATDADARWLLRLPAAGERVVVREQAGGDLALSGPAEGLLLFLWGRRSLDEAAIEVLNGDDIIGRWRDLIPSV